VNSYFAGMKNKQMNYNLSYHLGGQLQNQATSLSLGVKLSTPHVLWNWAQCSANTRSPLMTSPIGCSLKSQDSVHATCLSSSSLLRVTVSHFQSANRCGGLRWRWSGPGWCSPFSSSAITTLFYIKIEPVLHFDRACYLRGSC
jgi:hypothetical protein